MTDRLDPRIVRVGVEVDGQFNVYEDLDIRVSGTKSADPLENSCEVLVSNLRAEVRNYLLTETSPFNSNRTPKRMFVEAGRISSGVSRLFFGDITSSAPTQPPDIGLTLRAKTGAYNKGQVISRSGKPQQSLSSLSARVAEDLALSLDFQATDKQVANYAFSGPALRQVNALELVGGVDAFVDDQTLVVKDRLVPLRNRSRVLSLDSGMVGVPEVTERGIKVRCMLDGQVTLGGALEVVSKINPALSGGYTIYKMDFEVANRSSPFYWIIEASRNGYTPPENADV